MIRRSDGLPCSTGAYNAKSGRTIFSSIDWNNVEASSKVVTFEPFLTRIGPSSFRDCARTDFCVYE